MLIAHLPSGYLLGRGIHARGPVMAAALLGAVAPDFDMIWFHLVDHSVHHHRFWPHIPAIWLVMTAVVLPLAARFRPSLVSPAAAFFAAVFVHLLLDTVGGGIMWLWPFSDHLFELVTVPATQSHWIASFILHWTFLLEIAICIAASAILCRRNRAAP